MPRKKKREFSPEELRLAKAFKTVMSFPEGREVMQHVFLLTGYGERSLRLDPNSLEINVQATLFGNAKRDIWMLIQPHLSPQDRASLEIPHGDTDDE